MSTLKLMLCGLPKSGTTTIHYALLQAGLDSQHHKREKGGPHLADLLWEAYRAGMDPLTHLRGVQAITEAVRTEYNWSCWPCLDMSFLHAVRRHHPDAWLVLQTRRIPELVDSIMRWKDLRERMAASGIATGTDAQLAVWIDDHYERVRSQFEDDPRFLEIAIEDPHTPRQLSEALGIPLPWWGVKRRNPKNLVDSA